MLSRKFFSTSIIILVIFLLSGCTLSGKPDGGVYKSSDGGSNFKQKAYIDEENSIARVNVLDIEIDPDQEGVVYIGTDTMGILKTTDGGDNWIRDLSNFNTVTSIKRVSGSQKIYITAKKGSRGKVFRTDDDGENWNEIYTEKTNGSLVGAIAYDYNNPDILYIGTSKGGIFKSKDGGKTWETLFWASNGIRKIIIDRVNSSSIYFTTGNGLLLSKNAGKDFSEIKKSEDILNLVVHPNQEGSLYVSDKKGLSKSTDYGDNWEILNTLVKPKEIVSRGLAVNPSNSNEIFYSSGRAFYKSTDDGITWQPVQFNIGRSIREIEIDPHNSDLIYLGTFMKESSSFQLFPG